MKQDRNHHKNIKRSRGLRFRLLNNRILFYASLIIIFIFVPICFYYLENNHWLPTPYRIFTQFSLAVIGGLITSAYFSWILYIHRLDLRKWFDSEPISIRAPLMLASAPFLIAKKYNIFEKNDVNVEIDFRFAGVNALSDLKNDLCRFAIASDIAIINFLEKDVDFDIYSLPFVKIKNHIKILVKPGSTINSISDLDGKTIACVKESVHRHYLDLLQKELNVHCTRIEANGVLECYLSVNNNEADACIFWEPYYMTMENVFQLRAIETDSLYEWYLCLISKKGDLELLTASNILKSLIEATRRCNVDHFSVAQACIEYMHPEFTGLKQEDLDNVLMDTKLHAHEFGIDSNMRKSFSKRLDALFYNGHVIAKTIKDNFWPGFESI